LCELVDESPHPFLKELNVKIDKHPRPFVADNGARVVARDYYWDKK